MDGRCPPKRWANQADTASHTTMGPWPNLSTGAFSPLNASRCAICISSPIRAVMWWYDPFQHHRAIAKIQHQKQPHRDGRCKLAGLHFPGKSAIHGIPFHAGIFHCLDDDRRHFKTSSPLIILPLFTIEQFCAGEQPIFSKISAFDDFAASFILPRKDLAPSCCTRVKVYHVHMDPGTYPTSVYWTSQHHATGADIRRPRRRPRILLAAWFRLSFLRRPIWDTAMTTSSIRHQGPLPVTYIVRISRFRHPRKRQ